MECMRDGFQVGQLLDRRFQTLAPLNHGSFGMVFLAKDTVTGDDVAIKCLTKPVASSSVPSTPACDDRSEELTCHTILRHPNLVNLIHYFETEAHVYLVLEYCSMGDLYEAIRSNKGPLETEHVRAFMLQLVDAVDFMHVNGLAHRDIKPENIFLTQDGSMKLGDFGLATKALWSHESCVGSDRYMAPEQYDPAGIGYSPTQADVWSIGICLLNILFSRNPFVVPNDSDVLFADYRRDRQSLFDIFPNMSQDTYEVLSYALAMDPAKRSLSAVRAALQRAVCFTTDDESLDLFCAEERDVVRAAANRQPLRTPSIQSPQLNQGDSFPWAKALQSSPPQPIRQLSAIPDTEFYDEDLFGASDKDTSSWFSVQGNTPSLASVLDSASFKSSVYKKLQSPNYPPRSDPVPITGSLPSRPAPPVRSMSILFSKKRDTVSKSWSDMWEEDESESEEVAKSQESCDNCQDDITIRPGILTESTSNSSNKQLSKTLPASVARMGSKKPSDGSDENVQTWGGRFKSRKRSASKPASDKWAALGDKRRNYRATKESLSSSGKKMAMNMAWRRDWGLGSSGFDHGAWNRKGSRGGTGNRAYLDHDWRHQSIHHRGGGFDGISDEDEHEWVGGWHAFHL
ncbi:MAG: hypothetical protein Q9160_001282 [Pyrenula sp. 1 TL-2023]